MSVRTMALVWDRFPGAGSTLLAMLALADYSNDSGENIHPSVRTFAAKIRLSPRQARKLLRQLEAEGWIRTISHSTGGLPTATRRYRINIEKLSATPVVGDTPVAHDTPVTGDRHPCHGGPEPLSPVTPKPSLTVIEPSNNAHAQVRNPTDAQLAEAFEQFWEAYPLHKDKKRAKKAFLKIRPDDNLLDRMLEAIEQQKAEREWKEKQGKFVPSWKHPSTWLNGQCWEDEVDLSEQTEAEPVHRLPAGEYV